MMNKVFGAKNITHLLYGIAVLLPMLSVLGRVCYTVVNKNAKDSYSDKIVYQTTNINQANYDSSTTYNFKYINASTSNSSVRTFEYISITATDLNITQSVYDSLSTWALRSNNKIWFGDGTTMNLVEKDLSLSIFSNFNAMGQYLQLMDSVFDITLISLQNASLDNAFEYSLKTFVDDNNLGNVNLFSWFTDLFLDQSKPKNQLYINFVNWYLNYTLLVSSGYLLFMVMIWFTQYVRKIMDKSMYQDFGGF